MPAVKKTAAPSGEIAELSRALHQDMSQREPLSLVGGAELAGAQIADEQGEPLRDEPGVQLISE